MAETFLNQNILEQYIPLPHLLDGNYKIGLFGYVYDLNVRDECELGTTKVPDDEPNETVAKSSIGPKIGLG